MSQQASRVTGSLRSSVQVVGLLLPLNVLIGEGGIHSGEVLLIRKSDSTATDVSSSSLPYFSERCSECLGGNTNFDTLRLTVCSGVGGGESVIMLSHCRFNSSTSLFELQGK